MLYTARRGHGHRRVAQQGGEHQLTSLALAFPESLAVDDGKCQKHQDNDDQGTAGQCKKGCVLWWYSRDSDLHQVCSGATCKHPHSIGAKLRGLDHPFPAHPSSHAMAVPPPAGLWLPCAHVTCHDPSRVGHLHCGSEDGVCLVQGMHSHSSCPLIRAFL